MPRLKDSDKKAKMGALRRMGSFFNPFAPSPEQTKPRYKKSELFDCVNRDGSLCKTEPEEKPKEDEDKDKEEDEQ